MGIKSNKMVENLAADTCVPSELYPYIYQFLLENELTKTAKKFKKEIRIQPVKPTGSNLVEVFAKHIALEQTKSDEKSSSNGTELVIETNVNTEVKPKKSKKKRKLEENINGDEKQENTEVLASKPKKIKEENGHTPVEIATEVPKENGNDELVDDKTKKKKKKKKKKNSDTSMLNDTVEEETVITAETESPPVETVQLDTEGKEGETETDKKKKKKKEESSAELDTTVEDEPAIAAESIEENNTKELETSVEHIENGTDNTK